jgi:hypothetical protein
MAFDEDEIREVRTREERRSKRPIDLAEKKRRAELLKKFREALESGDIEKFKDAIIRVLGQLPGTPEYEASLKVWKEFHEPSS